MSDPQPVSLFVQRCRDLINAIVASQDSNEREMLFQKLTAMLTRK